MSHILHLTLSYLNFQKNILDSKPYVIYNNFYTSVSFAYRGMDIEVFIYNDTFIKIKVDNLPYAICDGIKTVRSEIDRLISLAAYE